MLKYLASLLLLSDLSLASSMSEKVVIQAGKSVLISIPSESTVDVSPKKLIEVEAAGKGQIRLLGLRSGIAILKARNEKEERSYLIEVLSRDSQGDWLMRSEWQSYFCSKVGIKCNLEDKVISGYTDDVAWYYEARKACRSKMPCTWNVSVSKAAKRKIESDWKTLFPEVSLHLSEKGEIRLESLCDEGSSRRLGQIIESVKEHYEMSPTVQCIRSSPDIWRIDILVVAEREGEGDISNPLRWERIEIPSDKPFRAYIAELSENHRMKIVANPELNLSLGGTALIKDGQEIQTHAIQKDADEILWKQAGFRLELKFLEFQAELARLQLHLTLSHPQSGLRTIDSSEFKSDVWVNTDKLILVGRLSANIEGSEVSRVPWLSSIPLLGQLFTWQSDTNAKNRVDIYLRIRPGALSSDSLERVDSYGTELWERSPSSPAG